MRLGVLRAAARFIEREPDPAEWADVGFEDVDGIAEALARSQA